MVFAKPRFQFSCSLTRLIVLTTLLLLQPWSRTTDAQRRSPRRRPPAQTAPVVRNAFFQHEHHRKDGRGADVACVSCHIISSLEAPDAIAAKTKPDSKGFPYHDSCLECHRRTPPHFFRTATPIVCTVCHTR